MIQSNCSIIFIIIAIKDTIVTHKHKTAKSLDSMLIFRLRIFNILMLLSSL